MFNNMQQEVLRNPLLRISFPLFVLHLFVGRLAFESLCGGTLLLPFTPLSLLIWMSLSLPSVSILSHAAL